MQTEALSCLEAVESVQPTSAVSLARSQRYRSPSVFLLSSWRPFRGILKIIIKANQKEIRRLVPDLVCFNLRIYHIRKLCSVNIDL